MQKQNIMGKGEIDQVDREDVMEYIKLRHIIKIGEFSCKHLSKADKIKKRLENRGYKFDEDGNMKEVSLT